MVECTSDDDCVLVEVEDHEKTCQGYIYSLFSVIYVMSLIIMVWC